ncbi:ABC transporter ATP-binding protein [candidate division CSSED10-310 bacterium]|uniref:ABC transporter ATP-binding protein n=1 Tax=candidate division CSSED10-310 bacterium TaxID=2855610 RepID=A0ABV6YVN4_UNCC1
MCSEPVIRINNLSKCYRLYHRPYDRLKQFLLWRWRNYCSEFWALRGINLDIQQGETLGIVGRNGSGKSTLLQIICGLTEQTIGSVTIRGRLAALLELGAGFNPDFTGRENIYVNASIIGLEEDEIDERFDEIAAFADIGNFLDKPVKTYSAGMCARIAFAVAVHVEPDILAVDEILSVGDEAFQRKCFARINELKKRGTTILFVSHSAQAIIELCDRAFLLDQGQQLLEGHPKVVIACYQRLLYAPDDKVAALHHIYRALSKSEERYDPDIKQRFTKMERDSDLGDHEADYDPNLKPQSTQAYGHGRATISDIHIVDARGQKVNILIHGQKYYYTYQVHFLKPAYYVRFGMLIKTIIGLELGGMASHSPGQGTEFIDKGQNLKVTFPFVARLNAGTYFLNAGVLANEDEGEIYLHRILDACMFRIDPDISNPKTAYIDLSAAEKCSIQKIPHNQDITTNL